MGGFKEPFDYQIFEDVVKKKRRFVRTAWVDKFLRAVSQGAKAREVLIEPNKDLWRAQDGCAKWPPEDGGEQETAGSRAPHGPKRMVPPDANIAEGRLNPRGIPYLYLASDIATAIAEVRPSVAMPVTVAMFRTTKQIRLVNLWEIERDKDNPFVTGLIWYSIVMRRDTPITQEEIDRSVWAQITNAFSKPVNSSDEQLDYVPTQIIAEALRATGADGVIYESSLNGEGKNYALFDIRSAEFQCARLYQVARITYMTSKDGDLWVSKDGKYLALKQGG